jgi:hypothetical protein
VHHYRVGELAAQRLDLNAVGDGLQVAHRVLFRLCSGARIASIVTR